MTRATPRVQRVADLYRAALDRGEKPVARTFAATHGISSNSIYRALADMGVRTARKGRGKTGEPRSATSWRRPTPSQNEAPPHDELQDACARWGIDGAAEEYEVSVTQICAWLRAGGEG